MSIKKMYNKYASMPVQVRASLWYTICNLLQKGISFIIVPIYVRLLTTTEYGQYTVFQSWKEILMIFATLNLYCGVFTKAMVDYDDDRDRYTSCMQGLSTVITLILFVIYIFTSNYWTDFLSLSNGIIVLMFVYFIAYPSFSFWSVRQKVENKYIKMVTLTLLTSVLIPVVSLALYYMTSLNSTAIILGYLIVQTSIGTILYVHQFFRGKVFFIKKYWKHALKFNIPLIPHYLSLIILGQADRVMINYFCGTDKVAIYNLAYQVSMAMGIIISSVNNTFVPWCYEKLKVKQYATLKSVSYKLCLAMTLCTIAIILVAPEIIAILGTSDYSDAVYIMPSIAISSYFIFCYNLFANIEFYHNATKLVTVASVVGSILNIILNGIFIPMFGFIAAGYTTMICYFTFMIMHYIFMKKICLYEQGGIIPYNLKYIAISSILLAVIAGISILLYRGVIIRYMIIVTFVIWLIIKKDFFIGIFKELKGEQ